MPYPPNRYQRSTFLAVIYWMLLIGALALLAAIHQSR
jgi:hypothetical protein